MPYVRPTLQQLISQAQTDLASHLPGDDPLLTQSVEYALAYAVAGLAHGLHGHANYNAKQLPPSQNMDPQFVAQWLNVYGLTPKPAVKAQLTVTLSGTPTTVVPSGTLLATNTGIQYATNANYTIGGGGTVSGTVTAVVAGSAGNQVNGVVLTLVNAVAGVTSTAPVTATFATGADLESTDNQLNRLFQRLQNPPAGGGPGDYVRFALESLTAATRAWQVPNASGPGTVTVYFVEDGNFPSIIPSGGDVSLMQTAINALAPVTAHVTVVAPTAVTFRPSIQLGVSGGTDTPALRTGVYNAIVSLLSRVAQPIGFTLYLQEVNAAVESATSANNFILLSPVSDTVFVTPNMPVVVDTLTQAITTGSGFCWFS